MVLLTAKRFIFYGEVNCDMLFSDGVIAQYRFNESSGINAPDNSGQGNDGTLVNMGDTNWKAGVIGNCISLDGTDEYVNIASGIYPTLQALSTGSISFWFNSHNTGNNNTIFAVNDSDDAASYVWLFKYGVSDAIVIWVQENGGWQFRWESTATFANDQIWHHLVYSVGPGGNAIYIDGELAAGNYIVGDATSQIFFADIPNIDFAAIGAYKSGGGVANYWIGLIDNVIIYNRAISLEDVKALYSNGEGREILLRNKSFFHNANMTNYWGF